MFFLHLSNRTENLVLHLAEVLKVDGARDPFAREYFLIQSQGMERMLSQRLADVFGSWCNYEYMLPTRFFALLGAKLGVQSGAEDYEREKVCWHLENILREVQGACFQPLVHYMAGDEKGIKRYQLSQQLAYIFDQYQIMRLSMIDGWEQGKLSTTNAAEPYQMELWRLLTEAVGHSRHRGVFLRDLAKFILENEPVVAPFAKRLSVFGLHSLPPLLLHCLQAFSRSGDIHFYLLSPCEHYWTEQTAPQVLFRHHLALQQKGLQMPGLVTGHPLLQSLAQQGREFQQMLLDDVVFTNEFRSFTDPLLEAAPSLLHKVQSDLLQGHILAGETAFTKDESLVVTSAHSPHREMMILKDRILHWLDRDVELQLKDIVVMTPDIHEYVHLIPAVFHDIPHSIADRNPASLNTYIAAFLQFLKLFSGRFGWSEVLDLLDREEVYPQFEIFATDLELIRYWVLAAGIRWGLSAENRQEMGLPDLEECTWENGIDRLLMGYGVAGSEMVNGILPFQDIEGSMAEPLGGLSLFVEIVEEARHVFAGRYSLQEWAQHFLHYAAKIFTPDTGDALSQLYTLLEELGSEDGSVHSKPLSFEVICARMENAATDRKSSSGFLRGQLTFCSMLPMRSIPFKKVCLLGVNDTVFPKNESHPPFDLLGEQFFPGDRSRRSDDRYQFLEAILSARESLYLSYVGQSIRTNEELPPSVIILELLEVTKLYGVEDLVDKHPLHGFSKEYFTGGSRLFSYNQSLQRVASSLLDGPSPSAPWWHGTLGQPEPEQIAVSELQSFLRNPQKYFVQNILGIRLGHNMAVLQENEPFVLDSLQTYLVDQKLVEAAVKTAGGGVQESLQISGQWPLGRPGEISFAEKEQELHPFVQSLRKQEATGRLSGCIVDVAVGPVRMQGTIGSLYGNGLFFFRYANMKAKDLLVAWMYHCLAAVTLDTPVVTRLLAKDMELSFPAGCGGMEDLQSLVTLFLQGQKEPSLFFPEPALRYVLQALKNEQGSSGDPMQKAVAQYTHAMTNGMEAEWDLLFGVEPAESILGEKFIRACEEFLLPVWKRADVNRN